MTIEMDRNCDVWFGSVVLEGVEHIRDQHQCIFGTGFVARQSDYRELGVRSHGIGKIGRIEELRWAIGLDSTELIFVDKESRGLQGMQAATVSVFA